MVILTLCDGILLWYKFGQVVRVAAVSNYLTTLQSTFLLVVLGMEYLFTGVWCAQQAR